MARKKIGSSWAPAVGRLSSSRKTFEQLVADALDSLPEEFRRKLSNVEVIIEDGPASPSLLGLYHGIPQTERGNDYTGVLPDVITIYRRAIEARAGTDADLAREVRATVIHEIAHHFGISDERLGELGVD